MMNLFYPDYYFDNIYQATPQLFMENGIKGIIFDIDNTLAPYEMALPDEKLTAYLNSLTECGIKIAFVSNNHKERVDTFNIFGCYGAHDAGKPARRAVRLAMQHMGTDETNTALCGDQIFTDIFAGKRLGLLCILVNPIKDKTTLFFKTKRMLEKPILKSYLKKRSDKNGR
ncbi:MAG: YqeG family HAD IIIA-type phosphatase [Ruminococcaceae bacterium]|nr:YqeG family HAD IIIA-type phosphatase [Oscillospiraceae bacterium]